MWAGRRCMRPGRPDLGRPVGGVRRVVGMRVGRCAARILCARLGGSAAIGSLGRCFRGDRRLGELGARAIVLVGCLGLSRGGGGRRARVLQRGGPLALA